MPQMTKRDLMAFLDRNVEKGWMNSHTGRSYKAAANKILEDVGEDDSLTDYDVRSAVLRYANRHPGDLSAPSLRVYESRVKSALESFASFIADPTAFKPVARGNSDALATNKTKKSAANNTPRTPQSATTTEPPAPAHKSPTVMEGRVTDTSLAMPFPMRSNFLAQIVVPRDMTTTEAERLCTFVMALAMEPVTIVRSAS